MLIVDNSAYEGRGGGKIYTTVLKFVLVYAGHKLPPNKGIF